MPALNRLEASTNNPSLRLACRAANVTVTAVRDFAENFFDDLGGPGGGLMVRA